VWTVLAGVAFAETSTTNDGLSWETDLETAQRLARQTNKLVLVHFGGPWCEPCQALEKQVFSRPGFGRELRARFVAVKVDPRDHQELASKYGVRAVPTDVVITPRGQLIYRIPSPTSPAAYVEAMNRIADNVQPLGETANALASAAQAAEASSQQNAPPAVNDATDRYADYYRSRQSAPEARPEASPAHSDQTPHDPPRATPVSMRPQTPAASAETRQVAASPQPKSIAPMARQPGDFPVALDRYCPVTLIEKRTWQLGDTRWGARHRGRTYLFVNEEAQKAFLADPDRYSPVLSGNDPVMRLDYNQNVPGKREHGVFYNDRVYLFASEETFQRFDQNRARYTVESSQAMRR
jgi:thioredoxin-related protein/YHS domain-containing protein